MDSSDTDVRRFMVAVLRLDDDEEVRAVGPHTAVHAGEVQRKIDAAMVDDGDDAQYYTVIRPAHPGECLPRPKRRNWWEV